ncbi:MAG: hypothetical protein J3T61_10415 [Candidatus Brocadiales bacterium]|nr:hypothetical protein [Candidatus Bathyanammoxibius sp.]
MNELTQVLNKIVDERARQDAKWGVQNHTDAYWMTILVEELGEAAAEITTTPGFSERRLKHKLVQVAAVAVAWIEAFDRRTTAGGDQRTEGGE